MESRLCCLEFLQVERSDGTKVILKGLAIEMASDYVNDYDIDF